MTDRRGQIVDAAGRLFRKQGFQLTSVDEVIREAGLCGKGHFYHYFKSKEELGYAVLSRHFEQFVGRGLAVLSMPATAPLDRLSMFIDEVASSQAERDCVGGGPLCSFATEMAECHDGFRARVEMVFERWAAQIQALLWEARPDLRDDVDIPRLARFVVASLEGALMMSRVKRDIGVLKGIAEDLKRYIASQTTSDPRGEAMKARAEARGSRARPRSTGDRRESSVRG